jgi:hypothetical protein
MMASAGRAAAMRARKKQAIRVRMTGLPQRFRCGV